MATIIELGQRVKSKYPEYKDMSDIEVGRRVKAKYPEYSDFTDVIDTTTPRYDTPSPLTPKKTKEQLQANADRLTREADKGTIAQIPAAFARQARNLPFVGGAVRLGGVLRQAMTSRSDAESAGKTVISNNEQLRLLQRGIADLETRGLDATKTKQAYNQLLEQTDDANQQIDTAQSNIPTNKQALGAVGQTGLDLLTAGTYKPGKSFALLPKSKTVPTAIDAVTKPKGLFSLDTVKKALVGGAGGYGYDVSLGLQNEEENPYKPGIGTAVGVAAPLFVGGVQTAKNIKPDSAKIMQRVARISKSKQAAFEKTAGESVGEYLVRRDIYGNTDEISQGLYNRFETSKKAADDALESLPGNYKSRPVGTALDELFARERRVSSPGALSKDFKRVRELRNKYSTGGLSMLEINEVKRLYERNVKLDFLKQNLPESVARANNIDNALRNWQFDQAKRLGLKNLPEINKETRLAKQLLDDIGKEYAGQAGNDAISLSDWILLSGGDPTSVAAFLAKRGILNKRAQSGVARMFAPRGNKVSVPKAQFGKSRPDYRDFLETKD